MTMKKAKNIGTWILACFCLGTGSILGWMVANFSWTHILMGFFSFIGLIVLAVLTYAVVFEESTDQEEEVHSYPTPQGWDKSYEE
mgnify:FL=1